MLFFLQLVNTSPEVNIDTYWKIDSKHDPQFIIEWKKKHGLKTLP